MDSERKLWEDLAPTEKLAAIRKLAEQLKALGDDRALRHEEDEAQPIQLRPSACSRQGDTFLLSTAIIRGISCRSGQAPHALEGAPAALACRQSLVGLAKVALSVLVRTNQSFGPKPFIIDGPSAELRGP